MKKEISTCLKHVERGRQRLVEEKDVEGTVVEGTLGRGLQRWRFDRQEARVGASEHRQGLAAPGLGSLDAFRLLRSSERWGGEEGLEVLSAVRS